MVIDASFGERLPLWIETLFAFAEQKLPSVNTQRKDACVTQAQKALANTGVCSMPLLCLNWRWFTPPGAEPSPGTIKDLKGMLFPDPEKPTFPSDFR